MGYRVLVIDDDAAVRTVVTRYLAEQLGLEVLSAQTGQEALSRLEREPVDVVVTDLKMPGLSGIEVIEAARQRCPQAEILLMTGFATVESAVHAMKLGAFDYLQKPFPLQQLGSMVERALARIKARTAEPIEPFLVTGPASQAVYREAERLAQGELPLLITGESGTGKTTLARAIHAMSPRRQAPVRTLRCAALSPDLQEAELLGAGGLLASAASGTLVVAQVWAASAGVQRELVRLLDALEATAVEPPAGAPRPARLVATSARDLATRARRGGFRPDLHDRLAPRTIAIPPLRERGDEVVPLAQALLPRVARRVEGQVERLAPDAAEWLADRAWPGNVTELLATLERAALATDGPVLTAEALAQADVRGPRRGSAPQPEDEGPVSRRERERIVEALKRNAYNLTLTYQQLGMSRTTLWRKLKRYGITLTRSMDAASPDA